MHQGLRRAAVAIPIALALGAGSAAPVMAAPAAQTFAAPLSDLLATSGPLDGASARLVMTSHGGSTMFVLIVTGIDRAAVDTRNRVKVEPKKRTRSLVFRRAPHLAPQPR